MKKYNKQVESSHYLMPHYETLERFVGYFIQKELVIKSLKNKRNKSVLEIGPGSGFLSRYLKGCGIDLQTFDIAEDLSPDIVGDITEIHKFISRSYTTVCCFEVLEHLEFDSLKSTAKGLNAIAGKYLIVSVPQKRIYISLWIKLSLLKPLSCYLSIPYPKKHTFDGQHYWELGARKSGKRKFVEQFAPYFQLSEDFTRAQDPYHRYFIFEKV